MTESYLINPNADVNCRRTRRPRRKRLHTEKRRHGGKTETVRRRREATRAAGSDWKHERHPGPKRSCFRSDPAAPSRPARQADPSNRSSPCVSVTPCLRVWPLPPDPPLALLFQHPLVARRHHLADRRSFSKPAGHGPFALHDGLRRLDDPPDLVLCNKHDGARIRDHVIAGRHGDISNGNGLVRRHFDDASARGARGVASCEHRKVKLAAFIDIPGGTIDDHSSDIAHFRADRKIAAPRGRVDSRSLLDDNDVAWRRRLDGRGAQVTRAGSAIGPIQLDGPYTPSDAAIRRQTMDPGHRAVQGKGVQRIGYG